MLLKLLPIFLCLFNFTVAENFEQDLFASLPEEISALTYKNDYLIGGILSPFSGQIVLKERDLTARGAQNLYLDRIYISPSAPGFLGSDKNGRLAFNQNILLNYRGFVHFPHLRLQVDLRDKKQLLHLSTKSGATLCFFVKNNSKESLFAGESFGISNFTGDIPSGSSDLRNFKIEVKNNWKKIIVSGPDGSTFVYVPSPLAPRSPFVRLDFLLEKEILPNGKIIKFIYNAAGRLSRVESKDPKERYTYAVIEANRLNDNALQSYSTHTGKLASLLQETQKMDCRSCKGRQTISGNVSFLRSVSSPYFSQEMISYNDRFLLESYQGKDNSFQVNYGRFSSCIGNCHYRVNRIKQPSSHGTYETTYELNYDVAVPGRKKGETIVTKNDGSKIIYKFSEALLLEKIQYFDGSHTLRGEKSFHWSKKQWLEKEELKEGDRIIKRKSYSYDAFGNPILEKIEGDFTGEQAFESYVIQREYSQDGRHLLLFEKKEEGLSTKFEYLSKTNLPISKFTLKEDRILKREFWTYDEYHNLIQTIEDDGRSNDKDNLEDVKYRKIKSFILRQSEPHLHLPEWINETYIEDGHEKNLKKFHLFYDSEGRIESEEIFDANGNYAYTLIKKYNDADNLVSETNAFSQKASYEYDEKGRCISCNLFSGLKKEHSYDEMNRIIGTSESGCQGESREFSYTYDAYGLIEKTDEFQNIYRFENDAITQKPILTEGPSIATLNGEIAPVITKKNYDFLGRVLTETNALGQTKSFSYNIYGKPTRIIHADGTLDQFYYNKKGELLTHIDVEGRKTQFQYDDFGHLISKSLFLNNEKILEETYVYDSSYLIKEVNGEGFATYFTYDGAGRKIREESEGRIILTCYDALGHIAQIIKENGENSQIIAYKRDFLGRILEKSIVDKSQNILSQLSYTYDAGGNIASITKDKASKETFTYDVFNRLIHKIDPLGQASTFRYEIFQNALRKTIFKPDHLPLVLTFDPYGREIKRELGNLVIGQKIYDAAGNLLEDKQDNHTLRYTYTLKNEIASFTRAFGTPLARTTTFTYTPLGKTASKTLPDGTTLYYDYDALNNLKLLTSSDGQIHHSFTYNKTGQLLKAHDLVQNCGFSRVLNAFGQVTKETFSTGYEVNKSYDAFGRTQKLDLFQFGSIQYEYDSQHLRSVSRTSSNGNCLYNHSFDSFNFDHNISSETLLDNLGKVSYAYDLKGQLNLIDSPFFTERLHYNPAGNLVSKCASDETIHFEYDDLDQLILENDESYEYDTLYRRHLKNGSKTNHNELSELLSQDENHFMYDLNGNLILKESPEETFHFSYDPLNRLTRAVSQKQRLSFTYDPLGRRLTKKVEKAKLYDFEEIDFESYLYDGEDEIGSFTKDKQLKNFRVTCGRTVAVELAGKHYATLVDNQNNIACLIDPATQTVITNSFSAFGEPKYTNPLFCPWGYASKRLDPELNLINFGKRLYDPTLARFLTTDPAGFTDSLNLYQYVFNYPFRNCDPDGQLVMAIVPILAITWGGGATVLSFVTLECVAGAVFGSVLALGTYEIIHKLNEVSWLPKDPFNHPDWEDVGHPEAKANGHYEFRNRKDGKRIRYDEANEGAHGHEGRDHYHWYNDDPDRNKRDTYLDENGDPCKKGSDESHLYPPNESA